VLRRLTGSTSTCDVAALSASTLKVAPNFGIATEDIKIVARTGRVPNLCWAASARVDDRLSFNLTQTLLSFEAEAASGTEMVGTSLRITTFREVQPTTLRGVRIAAKLENWLARPAIDHGAVQK
jgi:ABC-type phosphate/phosphonate transport system substrate-binding protein